MRRSQITAAVAAAAAAAAAVPATAAEPWSAPVAVPGTGPGSPQQPHADLGTRGAGVLGWTTFGGEPTLLGTRRTGHHAPVAASGAIGREASVAPYELAAPPRAYAATRTVVLQQRELGDGDRRLAVAFGRTDERALGERRILRSRATITDADLAANDRGDVVVAWSERRLRGGRPADRLWFAWRRPGRSFSRPSVIVGTGAIGEVSAAVGEGGDLSVAFTRRPPRTGGVGDRRVQARFRRAGHGFGAIEDLGPHAGFVDLTSAIAANGRGYVAWGTQDGGEEANEPWRVRAAVKPAGPRHFRRSQLLDPGDDRDRPRGRVALDVAPDASATVAWSGIEIERAAIGVRFTYPVRTTTTDARAVFRVRTELRPSSGMVGGVVAGSGGAATILWTAFVPGGSVDTEGVRAAHRAAGAPGFAREQVVDGPVASYAPPALAAGPQGRLVAAWAGADARPGIFVATRPR